MYGRHRPRTQGGGQKSCRVGCGGPLSSLRAEAAGSLQIYWFTSDLLVLILRQSQQAPLLVVMDSMVLLYALSVTLQKWGQANSSGNTQCAAHEGQKSYRLSYE